MKIFNSLQCSSVLPLCLARPQTTLASPQVYKQDPKKVEGRQKREESAESCEPGLLNKDKAGLHFILLLGVSILAGMRSATG